MFGEVADDESLRVVRSIEQTGTLSGKTKYEAVPTIDDAGVL